MILTANLPRILAATEGAGRVLDIGGGRHPLHLATHVVDIEPFDSHRRLAPIVPGPPRFTEATWVVHDVCSGPLPFPDKFFDFSFCSHLLEDVRDPLRVCAEIVRVSRRGYIETPSRQREIFCKDRLFRLKSALGYVPEVGFRHHLWFVEVRDNHLTFIAKDGGRMTDRRHVITRSDLGRKMSAEESAVCLFWDGDFSFSEAPAGSDGELALFRDRALDQLRGH